MFTAVADASQVAEARRIGERISHGASGWRQARIDQVAIVVTELATNMLKHGGGGHIHAHSATTQTAAGLELLALDRGSGMTDTEPLHAGRLLDRRQSRQRAWRDRAPRRHYADLHACRAGLRRHGPLCRRPPARGCATRCWALCLRPIRASAVSGDNWSWSDAAPGPDDHAGRWLRPWCRGGTCRRDRCADVLARTRMRHARISSTVMHRALASDRGGAVAVARIDAAAQRRPLRRAGQYQRHARRCRKDASHGLAQRHGRTRRATHP